MRRVPVGLPTLSTPPDSVMGRIMCIIHVLSPILTECGALSGGDTRLAAVITRRCSLSSDGGLSRQRDDATRGDSGTWRCRGSCHARTPTADGSRVKTSPPLVRSWFLPATRCCDQRRRRARRSRREPPAVAVGVLRAVLRAHTHRLSNFHIRGPGDCRFYWCFRTKNGLVNSHIV